ncbi:MAG: endonuclease domain-containing protein [Opitutae bacterium]
MPQQLQYNPKLKPLAQELRKRSTLSEVLVWQCLRKGQRHGYDFHRQKPIGEYIVDFFSPALMLVIEIDGESHVLKGAADEERQGKLEAMGIRLLRFDDAMVKAHLDDVVRAIDKWIEADTTQDVS